MHYTLDELKRKTLKELKEIGYQLNVLPEGDRRCHQNWIDAIAGVNPPLLQLLEVSPVQEPIEPVQDAIEVQAQEPIEVQAQEPIEVQAQEPIESKFGRIVYSKASVKPIAQTAKITPGENDGNATESDRLTNLRAHSHCPGTDTAELHGSSSGIESSNPQHEESDRVLAAAGNGQRDSRGALRSQPNELAAIFNDEQPPNRGDGKGRIEPKLSQSAIGFCASPVTFSPRFLATYPPYFGDVHYKAEATGQLNLLESVETDDEPPDPDDFASLDAFRDAIALWDAKHPELIEIGLDSFCEWAPCPDDWYEPYTLEPTEVMEVSEVMESSSTCNFSIPTFDAWCDRANRPTDSDEPPDTGIFAR
ncbi:hypothetical protein QUA10_28520, partial [Microcoleus sp. Pol8_D6]|uniref:hypothetical protein n=1 Tax=Microcoleus sp. Pol8_D6 TaxID=2818899 RepID=UPI002FD3B79F